MGGNAEKERKEGNGRNIGLEVDGRCVREGKGKWREYSKWKGRMEKGWKRK